MLENQPPFKHQTTVSAKGEKNEAPYYHCRSSCSSLKELDWVVGPPHPSLRLAVQNGLEVALRQKGTVYSVSMVHRGIESKTAMTYWMWCTASPHLIASWMTPFQAELN
ncbi:hypothetical protein GOODEAATRI_017699 [Goodea atripinnis]|uniref:Uncharacterized protein n=1 Tax=Goodea atripinnis TaxID=208336 RepID=A0ABV0PEW3_9TELE